MRKRILWISLLITFLAILAFSFAATQVYYYNSVDHTKEFLKVYMNGFDEAYYAPDSENQQEGAIAFAEKLGGARVTVMGLSGNVLGDSQNGALTENHAERDEVFSAIVDGEGFAVRSSSTMGENMIYYCKKLEVKGDVILVRIALSTSSEWAMFAKALPTVAVYLLLDILGCFVFTYAATYYILSPVEKLTRQAAYSGELKTKYEELEPVVRVLNERNRSIERQMKEIKEEKELVERAQNSKDEFISNITHEMNTPLTSIKGYAELLSAGGLTEEQKATAYATIAGQSERLTNLIACIINYNEISNDDLPSYDVDVSKLARETIAVLKPEADKKGVEILEEIDENVVVKSRHERVSEVLGNLIRNAVRYNKEGGSVKVTLNRTCLSVEDTGCGISEENIPKVFSRFFTVDKSHSGKNGGFGLGLAVVKKICDNSGWRISVESELGKGSKFTVEFSR